MTKDHPLISVIVPAYNEERRIAQCLESLLRQTVKTIEIIMVDDGSTDNTNKIARNYNIKVISIVHSGPGRAKKEGIRYSKGEILVFFDADMHASENYIEKLIQPIISKKSVGTFSTAEYVCNTENIWSQCWSINNNLAINLRIKNDIEIKGKVFRAIQKKTYFALGGFDLSQGYMDDMTLATNKIQAKEVNDAICYHHNPESLVEVYFSARWIGRSPEFSLNLKNILRFSILNSLRFSLFKVREGAPLYFIIFKIIFDFGILSGIFFKNPEENFSK